MLRQEEQYRCDVHISLVPDAPSLGLPTPILFTVNKSLSQNFRLACGDTVADLERDAFHRVTIHVGVGSYAPTLASKRGKCDLLTRFAFKAQTGLLATQQADGNSRKAGQEASDTRHLGESSSIVVGQVLIGSEASREEEQLQLVQLQVILSLMLRKAPWLTGNEHSRGLREMLAGLCSDLQFPSLPKEPFRDLAQTTALFRRLLRLTGAQLNSIAHRFDMDYTADENVQLCAVALGIPVPTDILEIDLEDISNAVSKYQVFGQTTITAELLTGPVSNILRELCLDFSHVSPVGSSCWLSIPC